MTTLSIQDHSAGNYTIHTGGKCDYRGSVRRNANGGGYTVKLDGEEWQIRNMPKVDKWDQLADAVAETKC